MRLEERRWKNRNLHEFRNIAALWSYCTVPVIARLRTFMRFNIFIDVGKETGLKYEFILSIKHPNECFTLNNLYFFCRLHTFYKFMLL